MHVSHALARSHEFDIVHSHLDWLPLALAQHCRAALVTTVHGFSSLRILPACQASHSSFVSMSDAEPDVRSPPGADPLRSLDPAGTTRCGPMTERYGT